MLNVCKWRIPCRMCRYNICPSHRGVINPLVILETKRWVWSKMTQIFAPWSNFYWVSCDVVINKSDALRLFCFKKLKLLLYFGLLAKLHERSVFMMARASFQTKTKNSRPVFSFRTRGRQDAIHYLVYTFRTDGWGFNKDRKCQDFVEGRLYRL